MKKLILLTFVGLFSIGLQAQVKIAYMNPNAVLAQLEEVAAIDQQIEALIDQRDQEIIVKAGALQQAFTDYEAIRLTLSPEEQQQREEVLLQQNEDLEQERDSYLNEIRQRRAQLLQPIIEQMDAIIQKIATEMGVDLVLNEGTSYGDAIVFYANEDRLNITDQVLTELKSE
jgi:outer membrane protein